MRIKDEYNEFEGEYVKMFTADGAFIGKLNNLTYNSCILNPYLEEKFDSNGNRRLELENQNFVYSLGFVHGMRFYPKSSIDGLITTENNFSNKNAFKDRGEGGRE